MDESRESSHTEIPDAILDPRGVAGGLHKPGSAFERLGLQGGVSCGVRSQFSWSCDPRGIRGLVCRTQYFASISRASQDDTQRAESPADVVASCVVCSWSSWEIGVCSRCYWVGGVHSESSWGGGAHSQGSRGGGAVSIHYPPGSTVLAHETPEAAVSAHKAPEVAVSAHKAPLFSHQPFFMWGLSLDNLDSDLANMSLFQIIGHIIGYCSKVSQGGSGVRSQGSRGSDGVRSLSSRDGGAS